MRSYLKALAIVFFLTLSNICLARWATLEDSNLIYDFTRLETVIKEDATYEGTYEAQLAVRKEGGREMGPVRMTYAPANSTLELVEAKTLTSDGEFHVRKEHIEDKPLASSGSGFDEQRQFTLAFPRVAVGSKLYYKFTGRTNRPSVPGVFSQEILIGNEFYTTAAQYIYKSALPLHYQLFDPDKQLEVLESKEDGKYRLEIRLRSPIYRVVLDETSSFIDPQQRVGFAVSTTENWGNLARPLKPRYDELLAQPLPAPIKKIAEHAKSISNPVAQLNHVTSKLSETVRYLGDWRTVDGQMIPRPMEEIVAAGFGDCKDFALLLTAIFRSLGYEAYVAWLWRGAVPQPLPKPATSSALNHAVSYVRKDGKTYWIDGTNLSSFAQGIPEDLLGRSALLLDANPHLVEVPQGQVKDSIFKYDLEMFPTANLSMQYHAHIRYEGRASLQLVGQGLRYPQDTMARALASSAVRGRNVRLLDAQNLEISSRIAAPIAPTLKFEVYDILLPTSAGLAFPLELETLQRIFDVRANERASDLVLGSPCRLEDTYRLKKASPVGREIKGCVIKSPWLNLERRIRYSANEVLVQDTSDRLQTVIPITAIRSPEFTKFQNQLRDCYSSRAIVFKKRK